VSGRGAVFIDRDGVINGLVADLLSGRPESPLTADAVVLIDGAAEALRRLAASGWPLVGISNQPAAAKGLISLAQLHEVQARVLELLSNEGVRFDDFRLCLHHPEGVIPELAGWCDCRKPAPGMLLAAARDLGIELTASWMVGDTDGDVIAGRAAGCSTVLIEHPSSAHKRRRGGHAPDAIVAGLPEAANVILSARTGTLGR
jgi:D-glycero-D-manno-heptose 1,7-bisphosphate phosphatase